jgi:hypothetical protein
MDRRDEMAAFGDLFPAGSKIDVERKVLIFTTEDNEGLETEYSLPLKWEVCPTCNGDGRHVNPSIDAHGLSREDFDADPTFKEDYFNGFYDVTCYECKGKRVVPAVDEMIADKETLKIYDDMIQDEQDYRSICMAEWRAEGRYL